MSTTALEWWLAASIAAALYPFVGYPLIVGLIALVRPRLVRRESRTPTVSILIPAYNEKDCIAETIENKLAQDYPSDLLEIMVVSDASDDGTDAIVTSYAGRGVKLLRRVGREGKAAALNEAVSLVHGEIVIFSDANSRFGRDAVRRLVENFSDPRVGYVTGKLTYVHTGGTSGRGSFAYMQYENWLRSIESRVHSVIGVNGGVDAMRRALYRPVPAEQITDFVLPLSVIAAGFRVIFDERASSEEEANSELTSEFRMRVRVALRALNGLCYVSEALNVFRTPLPSFCIISHKILRYVNFVFLGTTLILNMVLAERTGFFVALLICQLAFYAVAIFGMSGKLPAALRPLAALPAYFLMSNIAFGIAAFRFIRGDVVATWKPRAG